MGQPGAPVYDEATLAELERQAIDQLGVEPSEITGDPGAQPEIPPDLRERLESNGYVYDEGMAPVQ
jgi:hypothetical protein